MTKPKRADVIAEHLARFEREKARAKREGWHLPAGPTMCALRLIIHSDEYED